MFHSILTENMGNTGRRGAYDHADEPDEMMFTILLIVLMSRVAVTHALNESMNHDVDDQLLKIAVLASCLPGFCQCVTYFWRL